MPPSDAAQAGTDGTLVPSDRATPEAALLRDINHCVLMVELRARV